MLYAGAEPALPWHVPGALPTLRAGHLQGTMTPCVIHRSMSEQDFLSNSLFQLLGAMDQRPESL